MVKELDYPFDRSYILRKKRSIRRELLSQNVSGISKKIAVLGGSTTRDICDITELFLLNNGIMPVFYETEYNQYFNEVMFNNDELIRFKPDIIFIHTCWRNIDVYPNINNTEQEVEDLYNNVCEKFIRLWKKIDNDYGCVIIQNNFDFPFYRALGNMEAYDYRGKVNFLNRINAFFYDFAKANDRFYINDINYLSSYYGIKEWQSLHDWYEYKYSLSVSCIPYLAYNLSNIIKSIYGKNKKAFALDLDNTLWGGIIGDCGADAIEIGQENPTAQIFADIQQYFREMKSRGILLTVVSKNDDMVARSGFKRPDSVLSEEDFTAFVANWDRKDFNIRKISEDINLGADSFVFVDDNPAERDIVRENIDGIAVPELSMPEDYIDIIDKAGYFEPVSISHEDMVRNTMYQANFRRKEEESKYQDYSQYLVSLEMIAEIGKFDSVYYNRISQLTNKSNQFNLTTWRCSNSDIETLANNSQYITLYGKLSDKFGDNGVVSLVIGRLENDCRCIHIDLWLMSCRVLNRGMENAMMDTFVNTCRERGVKDIYGYYYPTPKNKMVENFYGKMGFIKIRKNKDETVWKMSVDDYSMKNDSIIDVEVKG